MEEKLPRVSTLPQSRAAALMDKGVTLAVNHETRKEDEMSLMRERKRQES